MEITKEAFEESLSTLLENININTTEKVGKVQSALEQKIDDQTKELKTYVHEAFETQQVFIDARFNELLETHELKQRVDEIQVVMRKVAEKVGVEYK